MSQTLIDDVTGPHVTVAPFGSWRSPVTSDLIADGSVILIDVRVDGDHVYWVEGRPQEEGRHVVVRYAKDGAAADVTPAPFNARTKVHEYGGGAVLIDRGTVYFTNFADQKLYRQDQSGQPRPIPVLWNGLPSRCSPYPSSV